MKKNIFLSILFILCLVLSSSYVSAQTSQIVSTLSNFTGPADSTPPYPSHSIGTFSYSIPINNDIVSAVVSGTWGNSYYPYSTAGVDVSLEGLRVAQCVKPDPGCFVDNPAGPYTRPWSYSLPTSLFSAIADGSAPLIGQQTSETWVVLGSLRLTITISPRSCSFSINPLSRNHGVGAETSSVSVTATSNCQWTASSNAGWITITSGSSGTGNGTVNYSVAANPGPGTRTGTLTIAGQTFTVNQAAPVLLVTSADSVSVPEGGTATFQVRLSAQPSSDVSVSVTRFSGDTDISVQSGSSLTFTTSNWSTNQTVTLSAAEDTDTANGSAVIRLSASGIPNKDVTATEADNDGGIPPTVTITSPTSNPAYSAPSSALTVGGTASDNVGVTQVTWTNDRGGSGSCSGTTSWTCSGIVLSSGQNVITVTALDTEGQPGTDTLTVTFAAVSDPGPVGSVVINGDVVSTPTPSVTLTLAASDSHGVPQMCVSNTTSCSSWEAFAATKPWMLLAESGGAKTVYVWFRDGLGNANPKPYSDSIVLNTFTGGETPAASFSTSSIDTKSYKQGSFAREIDPAVQKLVLKAASPNPATIVRYPYPADNNLIFNNPDSVISMQAGVSILESSIINSGHTQTSLWGTWYNDGSAGSGFIGDIFAEIAIRESSSSSGLKGRWRVCRNADLYGSRCENVGVGEFTTPISEGTSYPLGIQYDQTGNRFTFSIGSEFISFGPGGLPAWHSIPKIPVKSLGVRVLVKNADSSGFIKASFGNVLKNGAPYDNFTSVSIDPLKWAYAEGVRDTQNGKLRSQVKSNAGYAGIPIIHSTVDIAYPNRINLLKTKVTPLAYQNSGGVKTGARIYGYFYNSGTIGLLEEGSHLNDVGAEVGVGGDGLTPAGMWRVWRSTNTAGTTQEELASGTFNTPVTLGNTYDMYLVWDGLQFVFNFAGEEDSYRPDTAINPCGISSKGMGTYILDPAGREATVEASFDEFVVDGFEDIPSTHWAYPYIMELYDFFGTSGCSQDPLMYCPDLFVSREQMAAFIVRLFGGEPPSNYCDSGLPFTDVTSEMWSCRYIKRLKELNITTGYPDGRFGPYDLVSREQMATFLVRALEVESSAGYCSSGVPFSDVTSDMWSCRFIKRLKELQVTTGYGDGRYGPLDYVTRAQMAVFLARASKTPDTPLWPVLNITTPTSASTYATGNSPLSLGGSAADDGGVTQVTWASAGGESGVCSGTTSWNCSGISLKSGQEVITVKAWDESGKVGVGSMAVSYSPLPNPPPEGSVLINWGAAATEVSSVTLVLSASDLDDGVTQMCVSNDSASCTLWEPYVTERAWTLDPPGDGMRTVYVWFRDGAGNANVLPYSDSVLVYFDPGGGSI